MNEATIAAVATKTASAVDDTLTAVGLEHVGEDRESIGRCQLMGLMMVLSTRLVRMGFTEEEAVQGLVETMRAVQQPTASGVMR